MPLHAYDIHIRTQRDKSPRIVWIEATSRDAALVTIRQRGEFRPQDGERIELIDCEQERQRK